MRCRFPCAMQRQCHGIERWMAGHEARQGQDSQVFYDMTGFFIGGNNGTRQAGPPFQVLLLSSQYTIA